MPFSIKVDKQKSRPWFFVPQTHAKYVSTDLAKLFIQFPLKTIPWNRHEFTSVWNGNIKTKSQSKLNYWTELALGPSVNVNLIWKLARGLPVSVTPSILFIIKSRHLARGVIDVLTGARMRRPHNAHALEANFPWTTCNLCKIYYVRWISCIISQRRFLSWNWCFSNPVLIKELYYHYIQRN